MHQGVAVLDCIVSTSQLHCLMSLRLSCLRAITSDYEGVERSVYRQSKLWAAVTKTIYIYIYTSMFIL
jgi:hypothetical protein